MLLSLPEDVGDEMESSEVCPESPPAGGVGGLSVVEVQVVLGVCVVVVLL